MTLIYKQRGWSSVDQPLYFLFLIPLHSGYLCGEDCCFFAGVEGFCQPGGFPEEITSEFFYRYAVFFGV